MDYAKHKALIETLKSIGRDLWFGILGLVAAALATLTSSGALNDISITIGGSTVNLAIIVVAVVGFIAKTIDTYIHKNPEIESNGIAPAFLQK